MKSRRSIIAIILAGLAVSACSDHQPPQNQYIPTAQSTPAGYIWNPSIGQYVPQTAPQYVPQQPVVIDNSGISGTTALLGAAAVGTAAYMAGKANGQNQVNTTPAPTPQVTRPVVAPVTVAPPTPAKTTTAPVTKPFEPVRVHPQPAAPAPVASPKPAAPITTFKPVTVSSTSNYKPSSSTSFNPTSVRK